MAASATPGAGAIGNSVEASLDASQVASAAATTAATAAASAENAALGRPLARASDLTRGARSFLIYYLNQKTFSRTSRDKEGRHL